jgi:hypothetical protein
MTDSNDKPPPDANERRRASRIVHDERGNARVEWLDIAPERQDQFERKELKIADTGRFKTKPMQVERARAGGFDPYSRVDTAGRPVDEPRKAGAKRDLRKLGEWLKVKREIEERRARGDDDET